MFFAIGGWHFMRFLILYYGGYILFGSCGYRFKISRSGRCVFGRGMFVRLAALVLAVTFSVSVTGCESRQGKTRYEAQFIGLFDTLTTIVGYADSREEFEKYTRLIHDSLEEYHKYYDIYNDYDGINNIKTINDNAGIRPVKVDRKIIDLLIFGKEQYGKTNGALNIAMGSVLRIWHEYREKGVNDPENAELPPAELLEEAAKHTDINKIIIDTENSTVFLEDKDMSIDVGAIAKGYATEQVAQLAAENGFTSGLLSVGGNIRAIGYKNGKERDAKWNIGIQNPDKESDSKNLCTVEIADSSVVSSGDYERYYTVNGRKYNHIISPSTLFPAEYYHSVSIITRDSGLADALSTAIFVMPFEEGKKYIESLPGTEAMWVLKGGEIRYSSGFEKFIKR